MERIFQIIDGWARAWLHRRRSSEPVRYYISIQSQDLLVIKDVQGQHTAVLTKDGTFKLHDALLGLTTILKMEPDSGDRRKK